MSDRFRVIHTSAKGRVICDGPQIMTKPVSREDLVHELQQLCNWYNASPSLTENVTQEYRDRMIRFESSVILA